MPDSRDSSTRFYDRREYAGIFLGSVFLILIGVVLFFSKDEFLRTPFVYEGNRDMVFNIVTVISIVCVFAGTGLLLYVWFQRSTSIRRNTDLASPNAISFAWYTQLETEVNRLNTTIIESKESIREISARLDEKSTDVLIDLEEKTRLLGILEDNVTARLGSDLLGSVEAKYGNTIIGDLRYRDVVHGTERMIERLSIETHRIKKQSLANLIIGGLTTVLALCILLYISLSFPADAKEGARIMAYFLPRLSVVVFIELFAYFFLKLYKNGLEDTKYFTNELTNVESKVIALKASLIPESKDAIMNVILELARTERNCLLSNNQTTEALEKLKIENKSSKDLLDLCSKLFDRASKG